MRNTILNIIMMLFAVTAVSCDGPQGDTTYSFIGDSIVARWDLGTYFPSFIARNDGLSGSGVEYLESRSGTLAGNTVIVLSGTNDLGVLARADIADEYAERFLKAVKALGGERSLVISILPRNTYDWADEHITAVNAAVKKAIAGYPDFVYIDAYPAFLYDGTKINPQYSYDGLHLSPEGYEQLTHIVIKEL